MRRKTALLLPLLLCLSLNALAKVHYNVVSSVKVNGIDVIQPVALNQLTDIFKNKGVEKKAVFSECTANYDMDIGYPDKQVRLEFYGEDNAGKDLDKIFSGKLTPQLRSSVKGSLWVTWNQAEKLSDLVEVGEAKISPTLTVDEFKKLFPISAKVSDASAKRNAMKKNGYFVLFATGKTLETLKRNQEDEPPYLNAVYFQFKNGRLSHLAIQRAEGC